MENFITGLSFGFSGSGELLRLYYKDGRLADSVRYDDAEPWPTEADGQGPSIELIDPDSDNGKGENWRASAGTGTPGRINDNYMEARELAPGDPNNTIIISPNPASDYIEIRLDEVILSEAKDLKIYNTLGECVITPLAFGEGMGVRLDISPLPPGVYIVRFGDRVSKFIKL